MLINQSIKYVVAYPTDAENNHGYWIVVSAVGVYVGLAVRCIWYFPLSIPNVKFQLSTASYQKCINRLKLVTRSALVGLIHDKTMKSPSTAYDNSEATALMSTDADSLDGIAEMIHETWAQVVEVLIGTALLASQVGWIWPLPLFLIYCVYTYPYIS